MAIKYGGMQDMGVKKKGALLDVGKFNEFSGWFFMVNVICISFREWEVVEYQNSNKIALYLL